MQMVLFVPRTQNVDFFFLVASRLNLSLLRQGLYNVDEKSLFAPGPLPCDEMVRFGPPPQALMSALGVPCLGLVRGCAWPGCFLRLGLVVLGLGVLGLGVCAQVFLDLVQGTEAPDPQH